MAEKKPEQKPGKKAVELMRMMKQQQRNRMLAELLPELRKIIAEDISKAVAEEVSKAMKKKE